MIILILFLCGISIGVMSAFFGVGGGALMVPLLYSMLSSATSTIVISTSLLTIFIITSINSYYFYQQRYYEDINILLKMIVASLIGGYLGSVFSYQIETQNSKYILAVILLLSVARLLFYQPPVNQEHQLKSWKLIITGLIGSFVSSITGLGGGVIFVPMLLSFVHMSNKKVSAYSNLYMMAATFVGSVPHLFHPLSHQIKNSPLNSFFIGQVNIVIVICFTLGGIFGSKIGIKINNTVGQKAKKYSFAALLLILSIKLFIL